MDKELIESIDDISFKVKPNSIKYYEKQCDSGCHKIINLEKKIVCDESLSYYPYYYHCQELCKILPKKTIFYVHINKPFKILLNHVRLYGDVDTYLYFIKCCILTHNYHEKNFDNMLDGMGTFIILPTYMLRRLDIDCEVALIERFDYNLNSDLKMYHLRKIKVEVKPFQIIFDKKNINLQTINFLDFYGLEIHHNIPIISLKEYQKAKKVKPFNLDNNSHEYVKVNSTKYYLNNGDEIIICKINKNEPMCILMKY